MEYNSGRRIKNYLQLRCNVGMRLRHHGVLIGPITLIITVGCRRHPQPSTATPSLQTHWSGIKEVMGGLRIRSKNLWVMRAMRKKIMCLCVRMKISNLDANNIRSFDRVQAVMLGWCLCPTAPVMCWCEWGRCVNYPGPRARLDQEDSPKLLFQYHLGLPV